ncbi:IS21 family transposase [Ghiorsea bivora]|uniref:IS21 family transposase n=1 Tax=Ghiorsea bivora TaxID=1485545 RepID=UPI0012FDD637|nr:IS21 family transposase [Ghiorsea bivora]
MRKAIKVFEYRFVEDFSQERIASALSISRSAVRTYLRRFKATGLAWPLENNMSHDELESLLFPKRESPKHHQPNWVEISKEMKRKGATIEVLWSEYKQANPEGLSYSHFCRLFRAFKKKLPASARLIHKAGEQVMVDYAGHTVEVVIPDTGEIKRAQIFVGMLPCSGYTYAEATWDQKKPSWIGSHVRMFEFFGGVPRYLIPDNLKSAVTVAGWKNLVLNRTYEDLGEHYRVIIEPARPHKPKDKSLVELAVKEVERKILFCLRNHTFFGLQELNDKIYVLLQRLNNRETKKIPQGRLKLFNELEKNELKPLPANAYEYAEFTAQTVQIDYTINTEGHYYSVPFQYIGQKVDIKTTEKKIEVFCKGKTIASHPRSSVTGGNTINNLHMPENHKAIKQWSQERLLEVAGFIGRETQSFVALLEPEKMMEVSRYKVGTKLQKLLDQYGDTLVNKACDHAISLSALSINHLENILKNKSKQR